MVDICEAADSYFKSLNPLTRHICEDIQTIQKSQGESWSSFSCEEQEEILDKYIIDPHIAEKHKTDDETDGQESCFPTLKINCGEKIVIDFDNEDGWTWKDEHSGPFSWRTKSQQDLSILDDLTAAPKPETAKSNHKVLKKSLSPDRDGAKDLAFKPEKSIWDSPFLAGEKGGQNEGLTEAEQMFQKFGIPINRTDSDEASAPAAEPHVESDQPLQVAQTPEHENKSFVCDESFEEVMSYKYSNGRTRSTSGSVASNVEFISPESSPERSISSVSRKKDKAEKMWKASRRERAEAEEALISDLQLTVTTQDTEKGIGQVSPVYIEDPGESTTDEAVLTGSTASFAGYQQQDVVTSQPVASSHLAEMEDLDSESPQSEESAAISESITMKSGFDFLDNW